MIQEETLEKIKNKATTVVEVRTKSDMSQLNGTHIAGNSPAT